MKRLIAAAVLATAFWAIKRWVGRRHAQVGNLARQQIENWENEGGASTSRPTFLESLQVLH